MIFPTILKMISFRGEGHPASEIYYNMAHSNTGFAYQNYGLKKKYLSGLSG